MINIQTTDIPAADCYRARIFVDQDEVLGTIAPEIYGQYLEHVREADECIYPAIWDDLSPLSDERGLRKDVIKAVSEMDVPVVRWPGGSFANVYHWENGIGARAKRPTLPNKHWGGFESHQFGTDEFLNWAKQVGCEPYLNVNLGSGTLDEALRWLEYCNGSIDTEQGRLRAGNGHPEPYGVRYWGVGNETWADHETGHMDAEKYARTLSEWAHAMKAQDPSILITAVGSSAGNDPQWDREVLSTAVEVIDYLTLHLYATATTGDDEEYETVVFTPVHIDCQIRKMLGVIDEIQKKTGQKNTVRVAVDEWNIRHYATSDRSSHDKLLRKDPRTVQDALLVAGTLNVMLRHSPRVAMANYVFLINGHAPLMVNAEQVVRSTLFYVFGQYARWMRGEALKIVTESPMVPTPELRSRYFHGCDIAQSPLLDSAAALREDGAIALSLVNRHRTHVADVALKLPDGYRPTRVWMLGDNDAGAGNDFNTPERVLPVEREIKDAVTSWRCQPKTVVLLLCEKI